MVFDWLRKSPLRKLNPINTQRLDASPASIARGVDHAYAVGRTHLAKVSDWVKKPLAGLSCLELGPGPDFGSTLILAAFGAKVAVADRWLTPWDSAYHGPFYTALADRIAADYPHANVTPLRALVATNGYRPEIIACYEDAERLVGVADDQFDLVLSNAVFEHIADHRLAAARAFAVTKPGGLNSHQVDCRDHRDFSRPLEFLLMSEAEIETFMRVSDTHLGNPRRASAYLAAFEDAGFEVIVPYVTEQADEAYLKTFVPKLRAMKASPYHAATDQDLRDLGVTYILRKPTTPTAC
jgi:SAM-dependent methyltransferase